MENTLNTIRTRPRFKLITNLDKKEIARNLQFYKSVHHDEFEGNINEEMATIAVKTPTDQFWKPRLQIRIEENEEEKTTEIRGVFGPSSAVWTFFMFLYFLFSILWMVFISFWFVEKQIGSNDFPSALSLSFVMLFLLAITYIATKIGQIKAKPEMEKLRDFAEKAALPLEK